MAWDAENQQRLQRSKMFIYSSMFTWKPQKYRMSLLLVSKEVLKCAQVCQDYKVCNQKSEISIWT